MGANIAEWLNLVVRAAARDGLTTTSRSEQSGAGLDQSTAEEFSRFQELNLAYKVRFGFPFIIAVKGIDRGAILSAFEERLRSSPEEEFAQAFEEVARIALFRLEDLVAA